MSFNSRRKQSIGPNFLPISIHTCDCGWGCKIITQNLKEVGWKDQSLGFRIPKKSGQKHFFEKAPENHQGIGIWQTNMSRFRIP